MPATLLWRHYGHDGSQITSLTIVYLTVYSDADQRKHQSSASLAFVRGIHRGPVSVQRKCVNKIYSEKINTWLDIVFPISNLHGNKLRVYQKRHIAFRGQIMLFPCWPHEVCNLGHFNLGGETGPTIPAFEAKCFLATGQSTHRWYTNFECLMSVVVLLDYGKFWARSEENPVHTRRGSWAHLNKKMPSYQYRNLHVKDKAVSLPSYHLHGNPHIWKDGLYIETGPWAS